MNAIRKAWRVYRRHGVRVVVQKVLRRIAPVASTQPSLVKYEDAIAVDWRMPHHSVLAPRSVKSGKMVFAWIMSPPGENSGGHQNIFRFIKFLEEAGHETRIYLYSAVTPDTPRDVRARVEASSSYPRVKSTIEDYPRDGVPDDVDVIFATGWETAYRSYRDRSNARRLYFVQDYEPLFYATGSESLLAENTYRFGFTGITAGNWLAHKLRDEYGMSTTAFDFGADDRHYSIVNAEQRNSVFFYARPETARRGFELGVMALDLLARERPEVDIILAGQHLQNIDLPFAYHNPGNVQVAELNALYNQCAAGLVLSLTNMSLLPLELLSAGVIPVVNDGANNKLVSSNPFIDYAEPLPRALCDHLIAILDRDDQAHYAERAAASVRNTTWAASGEQFLAAVERSVRG